MVSSAIRETLGKTKAVILPIGSTEQHGPHLPTGTDYFIGEEIARRVAQKLDMLLLPVIPFGFSLDHMPWPGNISLSADTLRNMIRDLAKSLSLNDVSHIILMSGHAGHWYQLADICHELNVTKALGNTVIHNICPYTAVSFEMLAEVLEEEMFGHAEELETSLMLFINEDLVHMERALKEYPSYIPRGLTTANYAENLRIFLSTKTVGRDTKNGVVGDATLATKEKGEKLMRMMVDAVADVVKKDIS